jgi:ankyrin repeat protein
MSLKNISWQTGLLLKFGVDVDADDNDAMTPLHLVSQCHWGNNSQIIKAAQLLLENGVSVHVRDNYGQMPLHKASYHGISSIVGLLLKFGADVDAHDNDTMTPLFLVFQRHQGNNSRITKTAQVLLDHGANVHKQDKNGQMPLHKASQHCLSRIVEFLLKLGADMGVQDNNNITLLHFAVLSSFQCGLYKLHLNDSPVLWSVIILNLDMYPDVTAFFDPTFYLYLFRLIYDASIISC